MRIFISCSQEPSRTVAEALRNWLPDVIQSLEPWVSSADIGAGARWGSKVAEALVETKIGILCVTRENQHEPWLVFEAGALAKAVDDTFVCPYLIQMETADLGPGPLTQFQAKIADRVGTFALLSTINNALGTDALPPDRLRRLFERNWPDLEAKLKDLPQPAPWIRRPSEELLSEILELVRGLARRREDEALSISDVGLRGLGSAASALDHVKQIFLQDLVAAGFHPKNSYHGGGGWIVCRTLQSEPLSDQCQTFTVSAAAPCLAR
jgi:hypothetical protein